MKWFSLSVLLLVLTAKSLVAQAYFTLVSQMPKVDLGAGFFHIQSWRNYDVSYFPVVEYYTNFIIGVTSGTVANLNVQMNTNIAAGTWDLWVAMATQNTPLQIGASLGDTTVADTNYTGNVWKRLGSFTSGVVFSNVNLTATKTFATGSQQLYWFAGVGIMPTNYAQISPSIIRWGDSTPITERAYDVSPGNMVPNASFEFGLSSHGWTSGRNTGDWMSNVTTNGAFHGDKCVPIGDDPGQSHYAVFSPAIWLRGDRKERQYTLSLYYKRNPVGGSTATVAWGMVNGGIVTSANVFPTTNWQRFATNLWLKPSPDRTFGFQLSTVSSGLIVDAVQFEEGGVATLYAPADPIECNITVNKNGNVFNVGDTRVISVEIYNSTASSSNVTFYHTVHNWLNRQIASGTNIFTAAPGYSTRTISLSATNNGITRMYGWLESAPAFRSELVFTTMPLPAVLTLETNSLFGTHGSPVRSVISSNFTWGISWQRGLSPAGIVRMDWIEPTENTFTWDVTDARVQSMTNNAIIFANLTTQGGIPEWAYTNGVLRLDVWSNYVYQVVSRYKDRIRYWEDINEPSYNWNATNFAPILDVTAAAIKVADSNAFFVALGGTSEGGDASWAAEVWTNITATTKTLIDAVSVHGYPGGDIGLDSLADLTQLTGKPVWNTETGVWGWGDYKGDRTASKVAGQSYAQHWDEYQFRRMVWYNPTLSSRNWIRSFGRGMTKYFYYDARIANYWWRLENTNPTWFNYDDALNSVGAAYHWSKSFIDLPESISCPTNDVVDCLAFVFGRSSRSTLVTYSTSFTNYTATVTNAQFAVYDLMGNFVQTNVSTVSIGRVPTYWVTSTLSSNQLHETFKNASIALRTDAVPPGLSIDLTPHGILPVWQLPARFRWTAVDDSRENTDETPEAVLTRYRINGVTGWSDWSPIRSAEIAQLPATNVICSLEVEAKDVDGNTTGVVGPNFYGGAIALDTYVPTQVRLRKSLASRRR